MGMEHFPVVAFWKTAVKREKILLFALEVYPFILMWMNALSGDTTLPFHFASFLHFGQLLKEKNCSLRANFLLKEQTSFWEGLGPAEKQTGSHESCFPLS